MASESRHRRGSQGSSKARKGPGRTRRPGRTRSSGSGALPFILGGLGLVALVLILMFVGNKPRPDNSTNHQGQSRRNDSASTRGAAKLTRKQRFIREYDQAHWECVKKHWVRFGKKPWSEIEATLRAKGKYKKIRSDHELATVKFVSQALWPYLQQSKLRGETGPGAMRQIADMIREGHSESAQRDLTSVAVIANRELSRPYVDPQKP